MNKVLAAPKQGQPSIGILLLKGRTFIALFALLIFFSATAPYFLTVQSLLLIQNTLLYMVYLV